MRRLRRGRTRVDEVPTTQTEFHHATPIYEVLPGWGTDISGVRAFADLPANCRTYVRFLEEESGCRVSAIGWDLTAMRPWCSTTC